MGIQATRYMSEDDTWKSPLHNATTGRYVSSKGRMNQSTGEENGLDGCEFLLDGYRDGSDRFYVQRNRTRHKRAVSTSNGFVVSVD